MLLSNFEWDVGNLAKCQKHGVTIAEIEHALGSDPFLFPDYEHSQAEERNIAIGLGRSGRPVFVVYTVRLVNGVELVRPISARYMHRKEIQRYDIIIRRPQGPSAED